MSTRPNRQRLSATTVHVQVDLLYRLALRAAEAVLSSNSASMMFTCGGSDTPPRVFASGWPGNSRDVSRIQPGIKHFNTRKREFHHVHLRPRRTVGAITCATPTASYHEISINWNCTEQLHSSEPLKLNPGQFQKQEPPRGAAVGEAVLSVPKSGPTHRQHHTEVASSIPAAARVCHRSVFTASTRNSTLALDRSGSVLIKNTLPGRSVPAQFTC